MHAFELWVNTEIHPPNLAQFKPTVAKLRNPEKFISPEKAWEDVSSAVRRFGSYNEVQAFSTFTEPIKRAVRAIGGWQKVCQTELGREWDFLRKNFMDSYKDFNIEEKEQVLLPVSVLQRLQQQPVKQLENKE
jgi:hypothetical protein